MFGDAFTHWRPSATAPERQAGGPRGRAERAKSTSRRTYRASNSVVSESQLGRIIAGTEQVLRLDAVTIPPPPRPPTLSSGRRADCLRRGTGRAPRRAPQAESNVYSPSRCSPTRRPANAESAAVDRGQIRPARHPQREAPPRAQRRGLKAAERRRSATAVQALVRYRCAHAEARRSAPGKGWKLNRSNPRSLLMCTRVPVAGLSPPGNCDRASELTSWLTSFFPVPMRPGVELSQAASGPRNPRARHRQAREQPSSRCRQRAWRVHRSGTSP
jgi:hypothetical protein